MKKTELLILTLIVAVAATCFAGIGTVSVGPTTPVTVISANNGMTTRNRWFIIQNPSTNDIYLKMDSSTNALTTTNGVDLPGGATISVMSTSANPAQNNIMALSGSGTNTIKFQFGNEQ